jgi:hypothetical protein
MPWAFTGRSRQSCRESHPRSLFMTSRAIRGDCDSATPWRPGRRVRPTRHPARCVAAIAAARGDSLTSASVLGTEGRRLKVGKGIGLGLRGRHERRRGQKCEANQDPAIHGVRFGTRFRKAKGRATRTARVVTSLCDGGRAKPRPPAPDGVVTPRQGCLFQTVESRNFRKGTPIHGGQRCARVRQSAAVGPDRRERSSAGHYPSPSRER